MNSSLLYAIKDVVFNYKIISKHAISRLYPQISKQDMKEIFLMMLKRNEVYYNSKEQIYYARGVKRSGLIRERGNTEEDITRSLKTLAIIKGKGFKITHHRLNRYPATIRCSVIINDEETLCEIINMPIGSEDRIRFFIQDEDYDISRIIIIEDKSQLQNWRLLADSISGITTFVKLAKPANDFTYSTYNIKDLEQMENYDE